MFPNPQDALPLPPRPNLEQYKKLSKELVKACKSGKPEAIGDWAAGWIATLVKLAGLKVTPNLPVRVERWIDQVEEFARKKLASRCTVGEAQFVIARSHGFESWPKLAKHLEGLSRAGSPVSQFETAADAIITGDVATLKRLLRQNPDLIRQRSTREHHATLLHYVSANGVEGYRQKTPQNIDEIAKILLKAGAEVDADSDVYGGGASALGLVATSAHPRQEGVQNALLEVLLDHGASIEKPGAAGNRDSAVIGSLANGCPEAAEFLAQRGARLDLEAAAALGHVDVVKRFFNDDGSLKSNATTEQMTSGFLYACGYGRNTVVEFLLQRGVDIAAQSDDGQSGLHWAAIFGHLDTIKLLLARKAPLEVKNMHGGTVLGQTLWSAAHGGGPDIYIPIIETLLAAGAKLADRHPPVNERVDEVLRRHGSRSDPSLSWYGEKSGEAKS
jgi:hypothetical protein